MPKSHAERKATTHHQVGFCSMPVTEEQNVLSMLKNNALATTSKTNPEALQEAQI